MYKILFATSEVHPLIKTGGLADVSASLPQALHALGEDIRIVLPAYSDAVAVAEHLQDIAKIWPDHHEITVLEGSLPGTPVKVWFLESHEFFSRPGNPYLCDKGISWHDNAQRFGLFSKAVAELAMNRAGLDWQPDVVHCNDWQCGLIPALLSMEYQRPATVFTIHNLAYQGIFPKSTYQSLGLPDSLWAHDGLEFHQQLSFIKGGLVFSDRINTVSPTYAKEIITSDFGCGLEGLLGHREDKLSGILNGIDDLLWNPETDPQICGHFNTSTLHKKLENKKALREELNLPTDSDHILIGLIGRLVQQKGIDLVLDALPYLLEMPLQFAFLGNGETDYEQKLMSWAQRYPTRIALHIGYDEGLSHRIEAGSDIFLMPSRFEPCGLNQMYSQHYGTVPIVRNVGGLADTVVDALPDSLAENRASGIVFKEASGGALLEAVKRALILYSDPEQWEKLQTVGMSRDFSWKKSAEQYLSLYAKALSDVP